MSIIFLERTFCCKVKTCVSENFYDYENMRKKLSYVLVFALYPILGMAMGGAWGAFVMSLVGFAFFALAIAGLWLVNWLFKPSPSIGQILGWFP